MMNRTTETQIEILRGEYWSLYEKLEEGDIDSDTAESLTSILDSLGGLVRLEVEQAQGVVTEGASERKEVVP